MKVKDTAGLALRRFIVKAYVNQADWFLIYAGDSPNPNSVWGEITGNGIALGGVSTYEFREQIEKDMQYTIYVAVIKENVYGREEETYNGIVTKIEGLRSVGEIAAAKEAKKKAEEEAKAAAKEAKFNPNKLDRSQYKGITVSDFTFDMVAGNLAAGTKVAFTAKFMGKPTGTNYMFDGVNTLITLSSSHNFVRDMPNSCFGRYQGLFGWLPQESVKVFVTVKKPGQTGECSVDIVEWDEEL